MMVNRTTRLWCGESFLHTWEQEERPAVVSCPVTILGLEVTVEVHALECSVHSCEGSSRGRHKLTLRREGENWQLITGMDNYSPKIQSQLYGFYTKQIFFSIMLLKSEHKNIIYIRYMCM